MSIGKHGGHGLVKAPNPSRWFSGAHSPEQMRALTHDYMKKVSSLPAPITDTPAYANGLALVGEFAAQAKEPIQFRDEIKDIVPALIASIGAIIDGHPYKKLDEVCGMSYYDMRLIAAIDKHGYRPLFDWAGKERRRISSERLADLLAEKARDGVKKPVVVRRGRDHDEIEMVAYEDPSLIAKAAESFAETQAAQAGGGTTNIGHQTVYNVQLPDYLLKARKPEKVIEAEPV